MLRVGFDATPLLEPITGIPRYCRELLTALAALPDPPALRAVAFSLRGALSLPAGVAQAPRRLPARALNLLWARGDWPPVELLSGPCDVFHGTNFLSPPARRAASVVTVHDLAFVHRPETVRPASLRHLTLLPVAVARPRTVVLTPSEAVRSQVIDHFGASPDRVVTTPLGVDADSWAAAATATAQRASLLAGLGLDRPYVVFVGTDEPRKNLRTVRRAAELARGRGRDVPLVALVGDSGWGRTSGAEPGTGVLGLGRLNEETLRAVVAGSTALLLPSLDEGFGLPVLEAAAAGRSVILSDLPVLREVAAPGACFVDPLDVDGWSDALVAAPGLPDAEADRAARRTHAQTFTWHACAQRTMAAYRASAAL